MRKIQGIALSCFLSIIISLNFCWGARKPSVEEQKRVRITAALQKALADSDVSKRLSQNANAMAHEIMQGSMAKVKSRLKETFIIQHGNLVAFLEGINAIKGENQHERDAIEHIKIRCRIATYQPSDVESRIRRMIAEKHVELHYGPGKTIREAKEYALATTLEDQLREEVIPAACENVIQKQVPERYSKDDQILELLTMGSTWIRDFKERHRQEHRDRITHELMGEYGARNLLLFALSTDFQGMKADIQRCHHDLTNFALVADPRTDIIFKFSKTNLRDDNAEITDEFIQDLQRQHANSLFVIRYDERVRRGTGWVNTDQAHNFHEILDLYVLKYGQLGLFWKWTERGWLDPKLCLSVSAESESRGGIPDNVMFQYAFDIDNVCYHRLVVPVTSIRGRNLPYQDRIADLIAVPTLHQFAMGGRTFSWVFNREAIQRLWGKAIEARGDASAFWASFPVVPPFNFQLGLGGLLFRDDPPRIVPYVPTFLQYVQREGSEIFALEDARVACSISSVATPVNTVQIFVQCSP